MGFKPTITKVKQEFIKITWLRKVHIQIDDRIVVRFPGDEDIVYKWDAGSLVETGLAKII